MHTIFHPSRW